jgi:hypothetical protein
MNRNLSKRPKAVRRLDGALTAWRYFHGPNFVYEARAWRRRGIDATHLVENENTALFAVLVRFVEWMQAPITPWAGSPFVEFVDETGTRRELRRRIA